MDESPAEGFGGTRHIVGQRRAVGERSGNRAEFIVASTKVDYVEA